jgi:monoamine oxidase
MSRSSLMRSLQRMGTNQAIAEAMGSTAEEVRQRRESLEESDVGLSRRSVLKAAAFAGAGSAALCAGILNPPPAGAAPKRPAKVAVVGAGVAGLTAALSLKDQGFSDVTVYEANPSRVGGRMWTNTSGFWADYQITEWGGELIDSGHATMRALAKRFGIAEVDILDTPYEDTFYFGSAYYPLAQAELDYRDVHTAVRRDMSSFTWPITWNGNNTAAGIALSKLSIYDWIETRVPGGHASKMGQLIDVAYVIEFGADTRQQSAIDLLGLLGFGTQPSKFQMFGVSDERYRFVGGNQQIIDAEADFIGRDRIQMGWKLEALKKNTDGSLTMTFDVAGATRTVTADQVILALPVSIMADISRAGGFGPNAGFDERMDATVRAYPMGANNKVQMQFETRLWNQTGPWPAQSSGSTFSDTGYQASWEPTSKQAGGSGILNQYPGGTAAIEQAAMTMSAFASTDSGSAARKEVQAVVKRVLSQMEPVLPGLTAQWNGRATVSMWSNNQYSKGAYAYYPPSYPHLYSGYEGVSQGNVHFAGEYVSIDYQGYMEGGAVTGMLAAKRVAALAK